MSNNTTNSNHAPNGGYSTAKKANNDSTFYKVLVGIVIAIALLIYLWIAYGRHMQSASKDINCYLPDALAYGQDTSFLVQPGHTLTTGFQTYNEWYPCWTEVNRWIDVKDDSGRKLVLIGNKWLRDKKPRNNTAYLIYTNNGTKPIWVGVKRTLAQNAQL